MSAKYCWNFLLLIASKIQSYDSMLMQDGALGRIVECAQEEISRYGILQINWPSFSPDLNPLESVWDQVRAYIGHYPGECGSGQRQLSRILEIVKQAWNSVTPDQLLHLIIRISGRFQEVVDAYEGHIFFQFFQML